MACVRVPDGRGGRDQEVRTFQSFTSGLEALADWLAGPAVTHAAMEATGVYWKPVWHILEGGASSCCWSTPATSRGCPDARPML